MRTVLTAVIALLTSLAVAGGDPSGEDSDPRVFFVGLSDGDVVSSPVTVKMGVEGLGINPAGELLAGTGHHHILINNVGIAPPNPAEEVINNVEGHLPEGTVVPADANHIHFGKGQTETSLELAPGNYRLTLQFADGYHQSYGEKLSATVEITVQ